MSKLKTDQTAALKRDRSNLRQPALSANMQRLGQKSVFDLITSIYDIDATIEVVSNALNVFQPMLPGHLTVIFTNHKPLRLDGSYCFDTGPVVGKMLPMKSGVWRSFQLGVNDRYEKLSDLRVGKSQKRTDPKVRKLIDKLEKLLERRTDLVSMISTVRKQAPGKMSAAKILCDETLDYCAQAVAANQNKSV